MANSKWRLFEYEYSIVEFILSFIIVFTISYFLLVSLRPALHLHTILLAAGGIALVIGVIWTYTRARILFELDKKGK